MYCMQVVQCSDKRPACTQYAAQQAMRGAEALQQMLASAALCCQRTARGLRRAKPKCRGETYSSTFKRRPSEARRILCSSPFFARLMSPPRWPETSEASKLKAAHDTPAISTQEVQQLLKGLVRQSS